MFNARSFRRKTQKSRDAEIVEAFNDDREPLDLGDDCCGVCVLRRSCVSVCVLSSLAPHLSCVVPQLHWPRSCAADVMSGRVLTPLKMQLRTLS